MADNGQDGKDEKPSIYKSSPPEWLPKVSNSADLGFINFFPPVLGQDEDCLNEKSIQNGFSVKSSIPAETYHFRTKQIQEFKKQELINELEDFMNQIFQRRAELASQIPASTFRIPSRVTINESKRNAWFTDLANPNVPLSKLGKNIPHGARDHDLLDHLHKNNVAIRRAVWFIRVFGSNETAGLRNKPNYNPMQYSVEWTNVVTGYLKKHLNEIMLPSAPRFGLNIKQVFKGVLADSESRERWISKFEYTLDLLRVFYSEFMVDHTAFLLWLVQQLGTCNLAQTGFIMRLADDYFSGMSSCRALVRPFIESCFAKLQEISTSASKEALEPLERRIGHLIKRAFLVAPTSFVCPRLWKMHSESMRSILNTLDSTASQSFENQLLPTTHSTKAWMCNVFYDVEKRNEALLFRMSAHPSKGHLRSMVADVKVFNSITSRTDLGSISILDTRDDEHIRLCYKKLSLLLSWSVCHLQYGDHRPYAAASLLRRWRDRAEEQASRCGSASPNSMIQDALFDWLDTADNSGNERLQGVSLLFGELVQNGLFSYDQYMQRLISRGEMGLSFLEEPSSHHRMFLRVMPLYSSNNLALINQRRMTLYGVRARKTPEDEVEASLKGELSAWLPDIFKGEPPPTMPKLSLPSNSAVRCSSRYEQISIVKHWFMPRVRKAMIRILSSRPEDSESATRMYCMVIECLDAMKCYRTGLEFNLDVLKATSSQDLLLAVIDNLKKGLIIWNCMDAMSSISHTLLAVHQAWKAKGAHVRSLVDLLLEVDDGKFIESTARHHVLDDAAHFTEALCPSDENLHQCPAVIPEIMQLTQDPNPDAPSSLANTIWYKYRSSANWTWYVWDNVIASLHQLSTLTPEAHAWREASIRYANFILNVDLHSVAGIDQHAVEWFLGCDLERLRSLCSDTWPATSMFLLHLVVHGALSITTLLRGIVFPSWRAGSDVSSTSFFEQNAAFLHATTILCNVLLVEQFQDQQASLDGLPPSNLMELQQLRTRRKDAYTDANFRLLVEHIPELVSIESNAYIAPDFRSEFGQLRRAICCQDDFRQGAARNIPAVVAAFANPLDCGSTTTQLVSASASASAPRSGPGSGTALGSESASMQEPHTHARLISALRLIFNDEEGDDEASVTAFLSPWKLSASAAVTSFALQQIGQRLDDADAPSTARGKEQQEQVKHELSKLVGRLMHTAVTAQEAEFISEMAKGVTSQVAGEFVNKGLERIKVILDETDSSDVKAYETLPSTAGHFLTLLNKIMQPFRYLNSPLPALEESVQNEFMNSFLKTLIALQSILNRQSEDGRSNECSASTLTETVQFTARLLQFNMGFPGAWTKKVMESGDEILNTILQLSMLYGGGLIIDPVTFTLLMDTAFYIFDEFPAESRTGVNLFQHCPPPELLIPPANMPAEYAALVRTLAQHTPQGLPTADLVYSSGRYGKGSDTCVPVQLRPWEWMENLSELPMAQGNDGGANKDAVAGMRFGTQPPPMNNTCIPLEMFATRGTGEGVRASGRALEEDKRREGKDGNLNATVRERGQSQSYLRLRSYFEDDLASESIYERDWREGRVGSGSEPQVGNELGCVGLSNLVVTFPTSAGCAAKDTNTVHRDDGGGGGDGNGDDRSGIGMSDDAIPAVDGSVTASLSLSLSLSLSSSSSSSSVRLGDKEALALARARGSGTPSSWRGSPAIGSQYAGRSSVPGSGSGGGSGSGSAGGTWITAASAASVSTSGLPSSTATTVQRTHSPSMMQTAVGRPDTLDVDPTPPPQPSTSAVNVPAKRKASAAMAIGVDDNSGNITKGVSRVRRVTAGKTSRVKNR